MRQAGNQLEEQEPRVQITVTTSTAEIDAMGMTRDELQASISESVSNRTRGPDGEDLDLGTFEVEIVVMPTVAEFFGRAGA